MGGGTAEVCVVEAKGLAEGDLGILGDYSDPFVRVTRGSTTFESPIVMDSLDPRWDFCVEMQAEDGAAEPTNMTIDVFDHDQISAHDLLGHAALQLSLGVDSDNVVELEPTGQVRLVVRARPPPPSPRPPPSPPSPPSAPLSSIPLPQPASPFDPAIVSQAASSPSSLLAPSARIRGLHIGMAALLLVLGAALVVIGRLWGKGKLRRRSMQLLDLSAPRADGDIAGFNGPSQNGSSEGGQHVIELVQAIPMATLEVPPPHYDSAAHRMRGKM